jgi:hypothetical protein
MMTPRTRVRLDADLLAEIYELATERGSTPAQIYQALRKRHPNTDLPSIRTIQRAVSDLTKVDGSATWTLAPIGAGTGGSRLLLETLQEVIARTSGYVRVISQDLAGWVLAVRQVAPDLPPWFAYRIARLYQARSSREEDRSDLDAWLAFASWRSPADKERYDYAVGLGVRRAPMFIDAVIQPHTVREIQGAALQAMIAAADLSDSWRKAATEIAEALNPGHREFEPEVIEAAMRSLKAVLPELLLTHGAASDSGLLSEEESR